MLFTIKKEFDDLKIQLNQSFNSYGHLLSIIDLKCTRTSVSLEGLTELAQINVTNSFPLSSTKYDGNLNRLLFTVVQYRLFWQQIHYGNVFVQSTFINSSVSPPVTIQTSIPTIYYQLDFYSEKIN